VFFLHELGHSLGVPHLDNRGSFMNRLYDRALTSFGAVGSGLIQKALPALLERRRASPSVGLPGARMHGSFRGSHD
jgi:hypothetical protein